MRGRSCARAGRWLFESNSLVVAMRALSPGGLLPHAFVFELERAVELARRVAVSAVVATASERRAVASSVVVRPESAAGEPTPYLDRPERTRPDRLVERPDGVWFPPRTRVIRPRLSEVDGRGGLRARHTGVDGLRQPLSPVRPMAPT
jgi:hypothetical protein